MSYCKLYIDTEIDQANLESEFAQGFCECVNLPGVEYSLFPNEGYMESSDLTSSTYPVDRSRYYVEIDSDPTTTGSVDDFNVSIAKLIIWLRQRFEYVVASCDFEEFLFEVTGWNWTPDQPLPKK